MYHVLTNRPFVYFETADDRESLNEKANKTDEYLGDRVNNDYVGEMRDYGDKVSNYSDFVRLNPSCKGLIRLSLEQFKNNL